MARKIQLADLPAQPDPRAPLDSAVFLRAARPVLASLTADLLARADADPGIRAALERHHQAELAASRTADDYAVWRRHIVVQVAAAWLLSCVFVRILEDRGLIASRIAGPGARDSEAAFFRVAPSLGEREYLLVVFRELARLPAAAPLFAPEHNLVWRLGPSAHGCKQLLQLFRTPHADAPAFRFGQPDTRFLGDLYQHIDDGVRERFALLQTPDFVERFILDRTLEPAIQEYGIDHTDLIDPTCGSGHFLLGAFSRIFEHLRRAHPGLHDRELANTALNHVYGVDINPYAVSIARFRLTLQFLETGAYTRLHAAPAPVLHVIVADSLYHGPCDPSDLSKLGAIRKLEFETGGREGHFSVEDPEATHRILVRKTYTAVVGNPPYITVKDPVLREVYREKYKAATGQFALSVPFMQQFFRVAKSGGGYVGQITSSSFTKRDFGKRLIESELCRLDIELVINTSGAYIPGHNTPTVIMTGRNRLPSDNTVGVVLSKRGEPSIPPHPEKAKVWSSINDRWNDISFEDEYISVESIERGRLATHPWSLEGGGAMSLKANLERQAEMRLSDITASIGGICVTGDDNVFLMQRSASNRPGTERTRALNTGEDVRDWGSEAEGTVLYPYNQQTAALLSEDDASTTLRFMWPYRTSLSNRKLFSVSMLDRSLPWYGFREFHPHKLSASSTIAYAFIATHNHFFLDRKGQLFNRSSPVIKLRETATEAEHLALLAYLNSSTVCFWMKQVAYPKGTPSGDVSIDKGNQKNNRYEFSCTLVGSIPIPSLEESVRLATFSLAMEEIRVKRSALNPHRLIHTHLDQKDHVANTAREDARLFARMVAIQEDLDWAVYAIFGLVPPTAAGRWSENLELTPEQRPFKSPKPPSHLQPADRALWHARATAIAASKELGLVENPMNKRPWSGARGVFAHKVATFAERVADAAIEQIADLAEQLLRARCERAGATVFTARDLERELDHDPKYLALRSYLVADDSRRDPLREQLVRESVPFLAGYRYSPSGRDRHERWREVWQLQRLADVIEAEIPPLREKLDAAVVAAEEATSTLAELRKRHGYPGSRVDEEPVTTRRRGRKVPPPQPQPAPGEDAEMPPELLAAEAREAAARGAQNLARLELEAAEVHHRKVRKLIPVPSKYEPADFRDPAYFRLRGKLDVPRERFISYPGAASDADPAPIYGWAGWNHLQRALALLQLFYHRKLEEAWTAERLIPLLAGLEELLPWVRQWHADELHPETGQCYADAIESHIVTGCSELGVTRSQLLAWAPPDARRKRTPSPTNRARGPAPSTENATASAPSITNRRSARGADAATDTPVPPSPEITNKRRAPRRAPSAPSASGATSTTTPNKRRARPSKAG